MKLVWIRVIGGDGDDPVAVDRASLIVPPLALIWAARSSAAFSARGRAFAFFQARTTSERTWSRAGTVGRLVLDLAGQEAGAQDVGQLDRLVELGLGVEELLGELAPAADAGQADLGGGDLAVLLGLLAGEERGDLVDSAPRLGQRLEILGWRRT